MVIIVPVKRTLYSLGLAALVAACAAPPQGPPEAPARESSPAAAPVTPAAPASPVAKAKKPGPIPTRALNVTTDCRFRDESGYSAALALAVSEARVSRFEANIDIPKRGSCKFDLRNFRQTRELPIVELQHTRDACVVRVWEQGERVTVSFDRCRKMCSGTAWNHLWPILADRRDGSCG